MTDSEEEGFYYKVTSSLENNNEESFNYKSEWTSFYDFITFIVDKVIY